MHEIEFVAVRIGQRCIADLRQLELLQGRRTKLHQPFGFAIEIGCLEIDMDAVALRRQVFDLLELERGTSGDAAS